MPASEGNIRFHIKPDDFKAVFLMNAKKLVELNDWIQLAKKNPHSQRFLIVSGPSGCGKTYTIRGLIVKNEIAWADISEFSENQAKKASKYAPLTLGTDESPPCRDTLPRICLIDDLCVSTFTSKFLAVLMKINIPTILIITDPVRDEPHFSIWLKDLQSSCQTHHIEYFVFLFYLHLLSRCSPYPPTACIKMVQMANGYYDDDLIQNCLGDVRSLSICHYVRSLVKAPLDSSKIVPDKGLLLFHAVGKFLYKRKTGQLYDIRDFWSGSLEYFNMILHYNCLQALPDIHTAATALDSFSEADLNHVPVKDRTDILPSLVLSAIVFRASQSGRLRFTMPVQRSVYFHKT